MQEQSWGGLDGIHSAGRLWEAFEMGKVQGESI